MADTAGVTMKTARKSSEKTRKAKAFNSKGKSIGEFVDFKAAAAAVGQVAPSVKVGRPCRR
jgi:hypothetical protein